MIDILDLITVIITIFIIIGAVMVLRQLFRKRLHIELADLAKEYNYKFYANPDDDFINTLPIPRHFKYLSNWVELLEYKVQNYMEIPEKKWTVIWGDIKSKIKDLYGKHHYIHENIEAFYYFKLPGIDIPDFCLRDNLGLLRDNDLFSESFKTTKELDELLSFSYVLIEPVIDNPDFKKIKDFFSAELILAFLELDKEHLPDLRDANFFSDSSAISFASSNGISFYGGKDYLFVVCPSPDDFALREKVYILASNIVNIIIEDNKERYNKIG